MERAAKVKTALEEARMLVLGAQILLGFQFRGAFVVGFEDLPRHARHANAIALGLMVCAVALLITVGPYHRIARYGSDEGPVHRVVTRLTDAALLPFGLAFAVDLFITGERVFGTAGGLAAGGIAGVAALALWYLLPRLRRPRRGAASADRRMEQTGTGHAETPLRDRIEQMLTEARVVLPGAQALFAFQLVIVLSRTFPTLPPLSQEIHAASLGLLALAVMLLMAPAAYHRIAFVGEDSEDVYRVGSFLVTAATAPLALGLTGDTYVVIRRIAGDDIGVIAAAATALLLFGLWYGFPLAAARRLRRQRR